MTKYLAKLNDELIEMRRNLHRHPELAFAEKNTTDFLEKVLKDNGIQTQRFQNTTGLVGILKGELPGEKVIAVRSDIDALPLVEETGLPFASETEGICHACGHDLHMSAVLGSAILLSKLRKKLPGTVKFIFQPAEEGQQGAKSLLAQNVLHNPDVDYIFGLHTWPEIPGGTIGFRHGAMMASSDTFTITVIGKGGHAAHPHKCIDPVVVSAQIIVALQTIVSRSVKPVEGAVITIGKVVAGTKGNIIPTEAKMEGTIRTLNPEVRSLIHADLKRLATSIAEAFGAEAKVELNLGGPPVVCTDMLVDTVAEVGRTLLGKERVIELKEPSMGSEDFAFYLEQIPGVFFRIGTQTADANSKLALHSPKIIFSEQGIIEGAKVLAGCVLKINGGDPTEITKIE